MVKKLVQLCWMGKSPGTVRVLDQVTSDLCPPARGRSSAPVNGLRAFVLWVLLAGGLAGIGRAAPIIVLKLDDLSSAPYARGGFERVFRLLKKHNLNASFGLFTQSCAEENRPADYGAQLRRWVEGGRVELWHHGWDHQRGEFKGSGVEAQRRHLSDGLAAVKSAAGVDLVAFGAPFAETDADTITVLNDLPQIRVWFGPAGAQNRVKALVLHERAPLEAKVGVVSFELFVESFEKQAGSRYLVLVGHPPYWDEASFRAFQQVVQFCVARGCRFATASEAAALLRP
jgi:peptidoglycan/xylan/chitin deacetylase (PgdA/CDA1 family)